MIKKRKKKKEVSDLLLHETKDRRLFPNVPDPSGRRSNSSRRNNHDGEQRPEYAQFAGQRYEVAIKVTINHEKARLVGQTENISQTGMLVKLPETTDLSVIDGQPVTLDFQLEEGDLQEGTEKRYRRLKARVVRVIPCFNEETWIRETIIRCADQDYPVDKLELIIVDDGSSDNSVEVIKQTVRDMCAEGAQYRIEERVRVFLQNYNQGKREAMGIGIRNARTELIVFVDSDSFLAPNAIRTLVQPMKDPKMGGVAGRTDVANVYTNWLTKMQAVRYYISFRIMKAAEAYFDSVMCLSGPLSCYRLSVVREVFDKWINQRFLGQKATFGDDRSLTNYVVEHHRTTYQDHALCSTIVPSKQKVFLRQQMRWKRSWLRESLRACTFMWKKQPFMALSFYLGVLVPLIAPIIVLYNLVYVPLVLHIFPAAFLIGLLMMSLMMCFAQLILKKSSLWIYGFFFCLYYEVILLWQMIWAWLTFWVNDWGTRGKGVKRADMQAKAQKEGGTGHG